jgi:hypothetical protein
MLCVRETVTCLFYQEFKASPGITTHTAHMCVCTLCVSPFSGLLKTNEECVCIINILMNACFSRRKRKIKVVIKICFNVLYFFGFLSPNHFKGRQQKSHSINFTFGSTLPCLDIIQSNEKV